MKSGNEHAMNTQEKKIKYYKLSRYFSRTLLYVILSIGAFIFVFPFIWMLLSSFMTNAEITSSPLTVFPSSLYLQNYRIVFRDIPILRAFLNSIIVSSVVTFFVLFTSSLSGFMFAKMRFRGNNALFTYVLASLLFPTHVILIPLYLLVSKLKILDSYIGLALPFLISGFGIFLLRQFIYGIPTSLIEAARIDGGSDFKIYSRIILPLTKPVLSVLGILIFLWSYDEFFWPLVVVSSDKMKTLPLMLAHFTRAHGEHHGPSMAGSAIVVVPVLIVYVFFQRNFVKGMSMTGTKY
jgi:multiple sugar transport system permease protein